MLNDEARCMGWINNGICRLRPTCQGHEQIFRDPVGGRFPMMMNCADESLYLPIQPSTTPSADA